MTSFTLHPTLAKDCIVVGDLPLSRLLLMNNSLYPWCILVPRRNGVREIHELSDDDQASLIRESSLLARTMLGLFSGEKMNVAALGNIVPQLHIHHVVRSPDDDAWPNPVWGHGSAVRYETMRREEIRKALASALGNKLET